LNDYFALLQQPRRPWLDPEEVRAAFVRLSGEIHPDRVHNDSVESKAAAQAQFTLLNAACRCLSDPRERLRHLLELERGAKPGQLERLPAQSTDLYFKVGQLCRDVDGFLRTKPNEVSPLLKVRLLEQGMAWRERLEEFQRVLDSRRVELETELKGLSSAWETAPESESTRRETLPLDRLEQLYRELSYVLKWADQIRERIVQVILCWR
jgi:curved DNA-binding protein CbpA